MDLHDHRKQYEKSRLNRADLMADPIEEFKKMFAMAIEAGEDEPNAMTLATVDPEYGVDARIVLLKEVRDGRFIFYTNYLSQKGNQLEMDVRAVLVFFWHKMQTQIRIAGKVSKVTSDVSDLYFNSRPLDSRIAAAISKQSEVLEDLDTFYEEFENAKLSGNIQRPDHWGGFMLNPEKFEFWQGRPGRLHDRFRYLRNGTSWTIDRLYP